MATTYKVVYKNHCTPQEQVSSGGRYYLDSDCGRKLTGVSETSATLSTTGAHTSSASISTSATLVTPTAKDFVFVKNTGSTDVVLSLTSDTSAKYVIKLSEGEAFASEISTSAAVNVKTDSGTSTIDYFTVT